MPFRLPSPPPSATVLSLDPLVYTVPLLSPAEASGLLKHAESRLLAAPLEKSNPPAATLSPAGLRPLPLLCLLSGLPSAVAASRLPGHTFSSLLSASALPVLLFSLLASLLPSLALACISAASPSLRTSSAVALNAPSDLPPLSPLLSSLAASLSLPPSHFEAPVYTRYAPAEIFSRHYDASPSPREWAGEGGQRVATCIAYLSTLPAGVGGETSFPSLSLSVPPVSGTCLFFFPADLSDPALRPDRRLLHESLPASEEKRIVQTFVRAGEVPPPLGLPGGWSEGDDPD